MCGREGRKVGGEINLFSKEAGSGGQLGKVWVTTQAGREVTNVEMIQANLIWSLQAREI